MRVSGLVLLVFLAHEAFSGLLTMDLAICFGTQVSIDPMRNNGNPVRKTYSLADGVDTGDVTTTGNLDADIDVAELISAQDEDGLVDLGPEDLRGEELDGNAVDLDQALALDATSDGCDSISDCS